MLHAHPFKNSRAKPADKFVFVLFTLQNMAFATQKGWAVETVWPSIDTMIHEARVLDERRSKCARLREEGRRLWLATGSAEELAIVGEILEEVSRLSVMCCVGVQGYRCAHMSWSGV
jgi:hypothetical protein